MRVGFVTRLLWDRYGRFWVRLLEATGAEVVFPGAERVGAVAGDPRLAAVSGQAFREAAAQALALADADAIVVPQLNPGYEGSRGSAQDPFVADFPGALGGTVRGLPNLIAVPAELGGDALETRAIEVLTWATPQAASIRRIWQTHRADARAPRSPGLPVAGPGGQGRTIALVGQPWHLMDGSHRDGGFGAERVLSAASLPPTELREEGWRIDERLAPTDAEALGGVRKLARRPGIDLVRMIVDPTSGADAWLERRAREWVRRPFETMPPVVDQDTPHTVASDLPED